VGKVKRSVIAEAGYVAEEVARMIPSTDFVKFEDSSTTETTYAIFKVNDKVVKVSCDEIFTDIDYNEKVRVLAEKVIQYINDGLFC
jgi:hypothetical protein